MVGPHQILAIAPSYAGSTLGMAPRVGRPQRGDRRVAVVELSGTLDKPTMVALRTMMFDLAADEGVAEVVLIIDSPGGTLAGTNDLAAAVAYCRSRKPVSVAIEDLGASAAYWIASAASQVYVNPTGGVGSIGVYVVLADASEMFRKAGVEFIVVRSGTQKGAGLYGAKVRGEDLESIQSVVDHHARSFVAAVARGRRMSTQRVSDVADGRLLIGEQAVAAGLADGVKTVEEVLLLVRERVEAGDPFGHLSGEEAAREYRRLVAEQTAVQPFAAEQRVRLRYPKLHEEKVSHDKQISARKTWRR